MQPVDRRDVHEPVVDRPSSASRVCLTWIATGVIVSTGWHARPVDGRSAGHSGRWGGMVVEMWERIDGLSART